MMSLSIRRCERFVTKVEEDCVAQWNQNSSKVVNIRLRESTDKL
jgi:hypothetical protein